jgi:hypothetical protein
MGWATGSRNSEVVAEAALGEAAVTADILDHLFMTQTGHASAASFDRLVNAREHRWRNLDAERHRRLGLAGRFALASSPPAI